MSTCRAATARLGDVSGLKIGVVKELSGEGYAPGVEQRFREAVELLASLGAEIVEVSCPHFVYALGAYYLIMPREVSSNLAKFDAMRFGLRVGDDGNHSAEQMMSLTREAGFGAEVKRRGRNYRQSWRTKAADVLGMPLTMLCEARETKGAWSLFEEEVPLGMGLPPHRHDWGLKPITSSTGPLNS